MTKVFILLAIVTTVIACQHQRTQADKPVWIRMSNKISQKVIQQITKRYPVHLCSTGGSMMYGVKEICLGFATNEVLSEGDCRQRVIAMADLILEAYNSNEAIRPYLVDYPMTINNVTVSLIINSNQPTGEMQWTLSSCSLCAGTLTYFYRNSSDNMDYKRTRESYEDARNLVESNN